MFYKTDNPTVLAAINELSAQRVALRANAENFAREFDAVPVILRDNDSFYFAGLKFNNTPKLNFDVWRKPSNHGYCELRAKPTKAAYKAEWEAEKAKYEELHSKHFAGGTVVSIEPFYRTLGFDSGSLLFVKFSCFEHNGVVYVDTGLTLINAVEILGSDYNAAEKEYRAAEKAKQGE